jgi:hypothetical protein
MLGQWPLGTMLLGVLVGLAVASTGHWRLGSTALGAALAWGGLLRLILPEKRAGLIAVRSKPFDVCMFLLLGVGIVALAFLVPPSRG